MNVSHSLSTTRAAGAVGFKHPRHGQEGPHHNKVTGASIRGPKEATPNDNSVPLTQGNIHTIVGSGNCQIALCR